jgi:hypothetical protein
MGTAQYPEPASTARRYTRIPAAAPAPIPGPSSGPRQPIVALLCPELRLRRILRLSLLADDQDVVEWSTADVSQKPEVAAVVADLDSLCWDVPALLERLRSWGIGEGVALLLISVYPIDLHGLDRVGPSDSLQPPFSPQTLASRVRHLLDGTHQMAR